MKDDEFGEHKTYDLDSLILNELDSLGENANGDMVIPEDISADAAADRYAYTFEDDIEDLESSVVGRDHDVFFNDDMAALPDEAAVITDFAASDDMLPFTNENDVMIDSPAIDDDINEDGVNSDIVDSTFLHTTPPDFNEYVTNATEQAIHTQVGNKIFQSNADVNLQINCEIGTVSLTLNELSNLKAGDCLEFMRLSNKVKLRLNNSSVFAEGYLVEVSGMLGVKITNGFGNSSIG